MRNKVDEQAKPRALTSDYLEIYSLEAAYGPRWDANDGTAWSELFTEDGVFAVARPDGTPEVRARNRAELKGRCDLFNSTYRGVHLLQLPDLTIDGDSARSIVAFAYWGSLLRGAGTLNVVGFYKVEYVYVAEGWKMRYRFEVPAIRIPAETHPRDIDEISWLSQVTP